MKIVFVVWAPKSRRSESLSKELGAKLYLIHFKFRQKIYAPFKYPLLSVRTFLILLKERPNLIFAQNPPLFCPLVCLIFAKFFGKKLIVDAHTGVWWGFWKKIWILNKWIMKNAFLTIVTNKYLKDRLSSHDIESFVLEDKLPEFSSGKKLELRTGFNVAVINTFSEDEPIGEILKVARRLPPTNFYITGNLSYADSEFIRNKPENVLYTDFLPEEEYVGLLRASDCIMVLTTKDRTMLSGAYEAVSVKKPIITSNWPVLKNYFSKGAVYVNNTSADIMKAVKYVKENRKRMEKDMREMERELKEEWRKKFGKLLKKIEEP